MNRATQPEDARARSGSMGVPDAPLPFSGGRLPASPEELRFVERRVMAQGLVGPGLSFAALLIGFNAGWPRLTAAGVAGFGLTALLIGWWAARERRLFLMRTATTVRRPCRYVIYEGPAAVPYGMAFIVLGATVVGAVAWFLTGTDLDAIRQAVLARPGRALVPVGASLALYGLGFAIGFGSREGTRARRWFNALLDLPARVAGLMLIGLGAASLAIGLVDAANPVLFDRWFQAVTGNPWPFREGS